LPNVSAPVGPNVGIAVPAEFAFVVVTLDKSIPAIGSIE
jgi:hypothetical protein